MKKLFAVLAAAVFALCGCSSLNENNYTGDLPELTSDYEMGTGSPLVVKPALYFPDTKTGRLAAEVRDIIVPEGMTVEEVVVSALLNGPMSTDMSPFSGGLSLRRAELSGEVANVYLLSSGTVTEEKKFTVACAITNTLTDMFDATYVSVFFDEQILSIGGTPCGPLTKSDGDVAALYSEYKARYSTAKSETDAVLYFLAPSRDYMLSEVRRIDVSDGDYVRGLISELISGPMYKYYLKPCMNSTPGLLDGMSTEMDEDTGTLTLAFKQYPFEKGDGTRAYTVLECATLYYTLAGFVPGINRLIVNTGSDRIVTTRYNAQVYTGVRITLYFPDSTLSALVGTERTINNGDRQNLEARVYELMSGPSEIDETNIWPAFPEGISKADLRGITLDGTTAIVDISVNFAQKMSALSDERLSLALYSIVNTLAADNRVKRVMFLIEGERVKSIGGRLDIYDPLLPNPGMVR